MVPARPSGRGPPPDSADHCLPSPLARRRPRSLDPAYGADRRGDRLGGIRPERGTHRHLDLLARQGAARRLAPSRNARDRRAMGQTRFPAARRHRERPPSLPNAQRVLRLSPAGGGGHPPRTHYPPGAIGILPLLRAVSGFLPHPAPHRLARRRGPKRHTERRPGRDLRKTILQEGPLALRAPAIQRLHVPMVRTGGMAIERRRLERYRFCRWPVASRCFMLMSVG